MQILPQSKVGEETGFEVKGEKILIETLEDSNTYGSSIILKPDQYKKYARSGIIKQLGDKIDIEQLKKVGISIKIGDRVYFQCYAGADLDVNGKDYKVICPADILALWE